MNTTELLLKTYERSLVKPLISNTDFIHLLLSKPAFVISIQHMELTGGEPGIIDEDASQIIIADLSLETPHGRRSLCFDEQALQTRKKFKPKASVESMCSLMGVTLLNQEDYTHIAQSLKIDQKTSSWIQTPSSVREKGGALFMDTRYGMVFVYHNGAESYYESRGFRAKVIIKK